MNTMTYVMKPGNLGFRKRISLSRELKIQPGLLCPQGFSLPLPHPPAPTMLSRRQQLQEAASSPPWGRGRVGRGGPGSGVFPNPALVLLGPVQQGRAQPPIHADPCGHGLYPQEPSVISVSGAWTF